MIQAKEMRIGNSYQPTDGSLGIASVTADDIKAWSMGARYGKPISLTPEILGKCGFTDAGESVGANWHYKLISIPTNHMNVTYELSLFTTEDEYKYGINLEDQYFGYCKHLHQLQNLYFALTGEELNFEP